MEGWAGFGISPRSPRSTPALLKERGNDPRPSRALSILNKCFVSVPSLLFITNKYLSTESLAPRCFTVIHYFCHLVVLFLSPPLTASRSPFVTECSGALQLSSVLGGSWWLVPMCQASLPCVPYSLPSPEALPRQDNRARGFIVHCALPKTMPFHCFPHCCFFFSFCTNITNTPTQTPLKFKHAPSPLLPPDVGAKVHCTLSSTVGFWKVIRSFFLCHCAWRAGWLRCNAACAGVD